MNTLVSHSIVSPNGITEECAKFVIDAVTTPFMLSNVVTVGQQYTLSMWAKTDMGGKLSVCGNSFTFSSKWTKYSCTFIADQETINLTFGVAGTYYIYHPQLELGNKVTDWNPAPEDVSSDISDVQSSANDAKNTAGDALTGLSEAQTTIKQLADSISALVRDGDGGSLIKQDANGLWYFNIGGLEQSISDAATDVAGLQESSVRMNDNLTILNQTAEDLASQVEYVRSYTDENGQPCLELGEGDSIFKVRITNTDIQFAEGADVPAKLNRKMLVIEKAMVKQELQFGDDELVDGIWIWQRRSNGNLGLSWKGVSS